jgi:hypothetical protein
MYSRGDSGYSALASQRNESGEGLQQKGTAMTDNENDRRTQEREEIAARLANFRATQERFERERAEYFAATMENVRKTGRPSFWP